MYFGAIVQAVTTVILYFGMEETMYFRNTMEGVESEDNTPGTTTPEKQVEPTSENTVAGVGPETTTTGITMPEKQVEPTDEKKNSAAGTTMSEDNVESLIPRKRSYIQKLSLFVAMPGRPSNKQLFTMMYRPLIIFLHFPCVDWSGL